MLVTRTTARTFGTCSYSRSRAAVVRCNVSLKPEQMLAAVSAGALLLVRAPTPAFASLPDGFKGPQGSDSAAIEAKLDALIEQRTGKDVPLPELNEVPQVQEAKADKLTPAMPLVAPMAPAVMDPPPPPAAVAPAAVEAPSKSAVVAAPAPAAVREEAPAPAKTGLQQRGVPAAASASNSNNGLLIGGGVAVLGVVAAAVLAGNNQTAEQTPATAAAAPAAPAVSAAPGAEGAVAEAATVNNEDAAPAQAQSEF